MPPTGLVVKKANSVQGNEVTVEWCAPRCTPSVDDQTYAFQVSVYEAETSAEVSTEEIHTEVGVMCQTPGGSRQPVEHRITGLTAYTEYLVSIRSRSHDEQNGPLSDVDNSPEMVVRAGVTPKGSGREQRDRSGLQMSIQYHPCDYNPNPFFGYQMGLYPSAEFAEAWQTMMMHGSVVLDADGDGALDVFVLAGTVCSGNPIECTGYENVLLQVSSNSKREREREAAPDSDHSCAWILDTEQRFGVVLHARQLWG